MFTEELAALKDRYLGRFNLVHVLSREAQDIELLHGRIDRASADALLDAGCRSPTSTRVRVRPEGMMDAVAEALRRAAFRDERVTIERFAASIPSHTHVPRPLPAAGADASAKSTAILDGARRTSSSRRATTTCSTAGSRNGIELPYSCKGGVCSTCRCRLIEGEVDMDVNFALEDYEVARGFVLACQSYPVTDA